MLTGPCLEITAYERECAKCSLVPFEQSSAESGLNLTRPRTWKELARAESELQGVFSEGSLQVRLRRSVSPLSVRFCLCKAAFDLL